MNKTTTKFGFACAALAALCLTSATASAQCATCAVPQVAYSPVVYNTYYDGWYLGKNMRRWFGTAPAPAYQVSYAPTYTTAYAPTYSYASYAPSCTTCGTSPCACSTQSCFRPVVMTPTCSTCCYAPACGTCTTCGTCDTCSTCGTCDTCAGGVTQTTFDAPVSSSCPTCGTSAKVQASTDDVAPSISNTPPRTFQETDRMNPTPVDESADNSNADWDAPQLFDPNDQVTKRPTAPVWTAVYKKPASITSISAANKPVASSTSTIRWSSGR